MLSGEESLLLAYKIINADTGKAPLERDLRTILHEALQELDETLRTLTPAQREAALRLFLERIRETAFDFRLAILYITLKDELLGEGTKFDNNTFLKKCGEDAFRLARLYKLL